MPSDHEDSDSDDSDYNPDADSEMKLAKFEDAGAIQSTLCMGFGVAGRKRKINNIWEVLMASEEKEIQSKMKIAHNNRDSGAMSKKKDHQLSTPSKKQKFDQVLIDLIFIDAPSF